MVIIKINEKINFFKSILSKFINSKGMENIKKITASGLNRQKITEKIDHLNILFSIAYRQTNKPKAQKLIVLKPPIEGFIKLPIFKNNNKKKNK